MVQLLIALSVLEALVLVGVLAYALIQVTRRLQAVSSTLGRVAFGVRAIERQLAMLGTGARKVNSEFERAAGSLVAMTKDAES